MTTITAQSLIVILFLAMEACVLGNNNLELLRHGNEDGHYSVSLILYNKLCSRCGSKARNTHGLARFQNLQPTISDSHNRPGGSFHFKEDEPNNKRLLIEYIPFVKPIHSLLKLLDYELQRRIKHLWKGEKQSDHSKSNLHPVSKENNIRPMPEAEVESTPEPIQRIIRSTNAVRERMMTTLGPSPKRYQKEPIPRLSKGTVEPLEYSTTATITIPSLTSEIQESSVTSLTTTAIPKIAKLKEIVTRRFGGPDRKTAIAPEMYSVTLNTNEVTKKVKETFAPIPSGVTNVTKVPLIQHKFALALDQFERKYYTATFGKLSSISPTDRRENGISFVQSGLFLYLILSALSMEVDHDTRAEIDTCLALEIPDKEKLEMIKHVLNLLPSSNDDLKLRWSTRLVVNGSWHPSTMAGATLHLQFARISGNESPEQLINTLNHLVEKDSGGAMRNTFEDDELSGGVRAVLMNTLYVRARWRSAPTLLNGTHMFRDAEGAPQRSARMVRINDIMQYAHLPEWDAEAVEISYATPGLSLLLLVPRGNSLRGLSERVSSVSIGDISSKMRTLRVAATLPIYTLRMTLLLPNKLQAMGVSRFVETSDSTDTGELRLSHAVQRLMFWAEAGRNAFKDDGIEWDDKPELEMVVDRPYLFFVRWRNLTLMNGNFVL